MLSAVSTSVKNGRETINFVSADNTFFFHKQVERHKGRYYMRMKKRKLLTAEVKTK